MLRSFNTIFFFKQKTAYDMRISDWSSDVCSSDLRGDGSGTVLAHQSLRLPEPADDADLDARRCARCRKRRRCTPDTTAAATRTGNLTASARARAPYGAARLMISRALSKR